jgi:hypothetical protein
MYGQDAPSPDATGSSPDTAAASRTGASSIPRGAVNGVSREEEPGRQGVSARFFDGLCIALEEDRRMIEAQQEPIDGSRPAPMNAIQADGALGRSRRILERLEKEEA